MFKVAEMALKRSPKVKVVALFASTRTHMPFSISCPL